MGRLRRAGSRRYTSGRVDRHRPGVLGHRPFRAHAWTSFRGPLVRIGRPPRRSSRRRDIALKFGRNLVVGGAWPKVSTQLQ